MHFNSSLNHHKNKSMTYKNIFAETKTIASPYSSTPSKLNKVPRKASQNWILRAAVVSCGVRVCFTMLARSNSGSSGGWNLILFEQLYNPFFFIKVSRSRVSCGSPFFLARWRKFNLFNAFSVLAGVLAQLPLGGWKQCNFHHCGCIFTGERESAGGRNVKLLRKLTIYRCAKLWKPRTYMPRCAADKTVINFALSKHKQIRILAVLRAIRNIRSKALISFGLDSFDVRSASGVFQ